MMKRLASWILKLMGWNITNTIPQDLKKCVMVMAPHTSNWDFIIGRLAFFYLRIPAKFLIKKEIFIFPIAPIIKAWGGIPVDRSKSSNIVMQVSEHFRERDTLFVVVTPEGTRSYNRRWKKGFYYIAEMAKVPIALGYLDYAQKEGGVGKVFYPSDDINKDMQIVYDFYKDKTGKYPENFSLSPMYRESE
ncbi:MAG: 1-acyl-sn-glycerol-3-phosphate acyltransferase [Bacteroidales bacterium]|nr:1-acyl-sn-glycerol-3-phosphate acyltransferase [Bacteroidales bacterium]